MRNIIFDTDIGIDCDDAVALTMLLELQRRKECCLKAITVSSVRVGATATIKAILNHFGIDTIPIGVRVGEPLCCDYTNTYANSAKEKYGTKDCFCDAVKTLRRVLSKATTKTTIIAVGPLSNIAALLESTADEYSLLDGVSLVNEKVDEFFIMGGNFVENQTDALGEFNIRQDIASARKVFDLCPRDILLVPFECGARVYTHIPKKESPLRFSMACHASYFGQSPDDFKRPSWDPVTCLCAFGDFTEFYYFSDKIRVEVDDVGRTFPVSSPNGNVRYLMPFAGYEKIGDIINRLI